MPLPIGLRRRGDGECVGAEHTNMRIVSKQSASLETPTARSRRVVVAEDEMLIRLDIVETLTEAGYEVVVEAADGEETLRFGNGLFAA